MRGDDLLDDDAFPARVFAWDAKERASAKYPFLTHVSIRIGISRRSLIFSCCSNTTRALLRSFRTVSVRSFQPAAASSKAGRLVVRSESREDEREVKDEVSALVV
jgi:hypothetical protein